MGKTANKTKHGARIAKYSSHKVGASRKGSNKKQTGGLITMKNKARRAEKNKALLVKQATRKTLRLEMLENAKTKLRTSESALQKKFGTLNIRRLTDILANTYEDSTWYIARLAKQKELASAKDAKVVKKHVKFHKHKKDKAATARISPEVPEVHD